MNVNKCFQTQNLPIEHAPHGNSANGFQRAHPMLSAVISTGKQFNKPLVAAYIRKQAA